MIALEISEFEQYEENLKTLSDKIKVKFNSIKFQILITSYIMGMSYRSSLRKLKNCKFQNNNYSGGKVFLKKYEVHASSQWEYIVQYQYRI